MKRILILDINNGNLNSLYNIIRNKITKNVIVSGSKRDIQNATHIIFPGVGAFSEVMRKLNKNICVKTLENNILNKKKPFLGICVGMQVLFSESNEFKNSKGLNWINGRVTNLEKPSIGWSKIKNIQKNKVFKKNLYSKEFYFLHNFYISKNKYSVAILRSNITAIVNKDNIYGTQFHPENSHKQGVELLKNFTKV